MTMISDMTPESDTNAFANEQDIKALMERLKIRVLWTIPTWCLVSE